MLKKRRKNRSILRFIRKTDSIIMKLRAMSMIITLKKIKNLERQKILPPEIFNALDFNNIITFYAEILKQLKKYEIKIDLTPLFKKLQQVSKINTEVTY